MNIYELIKLKNSTIKSLIFTTISFIVVTIVRVCVDTSQSPKINQICLVIAVILFNFYCGYNMYNCIKLIGELNISIRCIELEDTIESIFGVKIHLRNECESINFFIPAVEYIRLDTNKNTFDRISIAVNDGLNCILSKRKFNNYLIQLKEYYREGK